MGESSKLDSLLDSGATGPLRPSTLWIARKHPSSGLLRGGPDAHLVHRASQVARSIPDMIRFGGLVAPDSARLEQVGHVSEHM